MEIDGQYLESIVKQPHDNKIKNYHKIRHILAFMAFLSLVSLFALRVNLSVAIVAMVKTPEESYGSDNRSLESCPRPQIHQNKTNISADRGEFLWDEKTQGLILGSFYYTYGIANIFGGIASDYFGGRELIGVGSLATAVLTLLTPVAARMGVGFLIGIRVVEGCFQGVTFPAINKLITKWYTTKERSKFTGIIFSGMDLGTVLTFFVSGWLCESEFLGGWPLVFYIPGSLSIIWAIFWFVLIRNEPKNHPRISAEELKCILEGRPDSQESHPVPWLSLLCSIPFWVTVVAHIGANFGYYILLAELPTYLDNILHVSMNSNGVISAMPFLATWIFSIVYSFIIDNAISTGNLSILAVRRISVAISCYGPMLCLIGMCFVNCSIGGAFTVLIMTGALNGAAYCGLFASYSDLAPRFAGTLMGLGNAFGGIGGFVGPAITGVVTEGNQSIAAWRIVFIICAIVYGISTTVYEIFITTEPQPWNEIKKSKQNEEESSVEEKFLQNCHQ